MWSKNGSNIAVCWVKWAHTDVCLFSGWWWWTRFCAMLYSMMMIWHHFSWCCDSICVNYEPPTEADPIWNSFPWPRWLLKALYHPSTFISGTEDHPECQLSVTSCKRTGSVSCSRTVWRANFRVGKCTTDPHMGSCHWPPSLAPALQRGSSHFVSINIIWSDERIKFVKQPGLEVVPNSGFHSIQPQ